MSIDKLFGIKPEAIKVWGAADVEVDLNTVGLEASPTNVFRSFTPAPKGKGITVAGDSPKELADNLLIGLKGKHGPAPIPEEGKWVQAKEIKDISGLTHGIGWCAPQQGTCFQE